MARLKSAYRPKPEPDNSAQNIPAEKQLPPVAVIAAPEAPAIAVQVEPKQPEPIPAAEALKAQLEALKHSEEIQRQRAAHIAASQQQPVTREQKLDLWKQQGLSDAEARFLSAHPDMIDYPQITGKAAGEAAQQGHQRDSEAFMEAMTVSFNKQLDQMRAQPAEQPTPEFFRPPPPPAPPMRSTNIVSAPVSRQVPGTSREADLNPRQMTLTAEEMGIVRASGISAAEYARGKLRLQREKASGERQ